MELSIRVPFRLWSKEQGNNQKAFQIQPGNRRQTNINLNRPHKREKSVGGLKKNTTFMDGHRRETAMALGLRGKVQQDALRSRLREWVQPPSTTNDSASDVSQKESPREPIFFQRALNWDECPTHILLWPVKLQLQLLVWPSLPLALCSPAVGLRSLPPGTIQEFHLCQSLSDHSGKDQTKEDAAD